MFDISESYTGAMVPNETPTDGNSDPAIIAAQKKPKTSEEILQYAREEAAEILEKAHEEAKELIAQKEKEIDDLAEKKLALKIDESFSALGEDLFSARAGISQIVEQSIHLMLGAIGSEKAFALAVHKATKIYLNNNSLKIHAHPDSANRLRLYNISAAGSKEATHYEIIDDPNLEPERCLLDTGEKQIEISLENQIQALKKSLEASLSESNS